MVRLVATGRSVRIRKDLTYFLRVYRAERGLRQHEAARGFRIKPSHWSLLEAGRRMPGKDLARRLAEATGAPLDVCLGYRRVAAKDRP